ncbi:mycothiol transferase [Glutamicibacter sp. 287]|uniref:mycothiol transferase n=1 Tax=unclassified Glutamicibacter TaxID=2627139 RepID=UPI0040341924
MENFPPWEPPMDGTEEAHLLSMLDRLRTTFRYKADGLDIGQLAARLPSSELSLGGLLQHLAVVEDENFAYLIGRGRPEIVLEFSAEGRDHFAVNAEENPEALYTRYDKAVLKSREVQAQVVAAGELDAPSALEYEGKHASVRRIICDVIEEYGRHTGHADLLREAIDGRVGEDPPFDYRPPWYA